MIATSRSGGITAACTLHLNEIAQEDVSKFQPVSHVARDGAFERPQYRLTNHRTFSLKISGCSQAIAWPESGTVVHS